MALAFVNKELKDRQQEGPEMNLNDAVFILLALITIGSALG